MAEPYRPKYPVRNPDGSYKTDENGKRVYKESSKYWFKVKDEHGVWRLFPGTEDLAATKILQGQKIKEIAMGKAGARDPFAEARKRTATEHLADYVKALENGETSEHHRKQVEARITAILNGTGAAYLHDIDPNRVQDFLGEMRKNDRGPRTRNSYLTTVKAFLNWSRKTRRIGDNPLVCLEPAEEGRDIRRERRAPTEDELRRLVVAARKRPLAEERARRKSPITPELEQRLIMEGTERALFYAAAFYTGAREGELEAVEWRDLDLTGPPEQAGSLVVRRKHSKAIREEELPLRTDLKAELLAWRKLRKPEHEADKVFDSRNRPAKILRRDLAFCDPPIPYQDAGDRYFDIHSFRHGTATLMLRANVSPRVAQGVMRHSDLKLTMKTYTDPRVLGGMREAVEALPSLPPILRSGDDTQAEAMRATGTDGPSEPPIGANGRPSEAGEHAKPEALRILVGAQASEGAAGGWEADALPTELRPHVRPGHENTETRSRQDAARNAAYRLMFHG